MATTSFDKFAQEYDKSMGDTGDYTHQKTIDPALFKAIGNYKGKSIYDIACGNGYIARKLAKGKAREVWASDISSKLIEIAETKYPTLGIKYFPADGSDFSKLPESYFDLVIMNMAIHYIKDLNKFFAGINRILKHRGRFVFTTDHPLKYIAYYDSVKTKSIKDIISFSRNYLVERSRVTLNHWTGKKDLLVYSRPLGSYINTLAKNGLFVDSVVEPKTFSTYNKQIEISFTCPIPSRFAVGATKI